MPSLSPSGDEPDQSNLVQISSTYVMMRRLIDGAIAVIDIKRYDFNAPELFDPTRCLLLGLPRVTATAQVR